MGRFVNTKPLELKNGELVKKEPTTLYYLPKQSDKNVYSNNFFLALPFIKNYSNIEGVYQMKKYSINLIQKIITIINVKNFKILLISIL